MLTHKEREWIKRVQINLDSCPTKRLGFYTIGDRDVTIYDLNKKAEIDAIYDEGRGEFGHAVDKADALLGTLVFPNNIDSTAG